MIYQGIAYPQYVTILGLLITLTGVHKLHRAVKRDASAKVAFKTHEIHDAGIIDFYLARQGLRYTIYGFLLQTITIIM